MSLNKILFLAYFVFKEFSRKILQNFFFKDITNSILNQNLKSQKSYKKDRNQPEYKSIKNFIILFFLF